MKKKSGRIILIAAVLFACWLQFPVGMHIKKAIPGVKATCVETGLTEGKKCSLCGKVLVAQQEIPATGLHTFTDDFDKTCEHCSHIREVSSTFDFVNHRVVLVDENQSHSNWRVTVFALGDKSVENPTDEEALQAIDGTAKTHWGVVDINSILLTDPGNYVLLLKYNIGENVAIKVPMPLTITDEPKLVVDGENRVRVIDDNATNKNHVLTVYEMGDAVVDNLENEDEVKNAAVNAKSYVGKTEINELVITNGGNYVLYLCYETADNSTKTITLSASLTNSRPKLYVGPENQLGVICDDDKANHFRAYVYYLGEQTVEDIYDVTALEEIAGKPTIFWKLENNSKAVLQEPGNYVIHLHYNVETGPKETVATKLTIANHENNDSP